LVICFLGAVWAQTRPIISEVFAAEQIIEVGNGTKVFLGRGAEFRDRTKGVGVLQHLFPLETQEDLYLLERYDLGEIFSVAAREPCKLTKLNNDTMPEYWGWLKYANYTGKATRGGFTNVFWEADVGYAKVGVSVIENTNYPTATWRLSPQRNTSADFVEFTPFIRANDHWFDIPGECKNANASQLTPPAMPGCIAGATIISRAQDWVNAKVPYNQGATYQGYREDCSGYVSMAWDLGGPGRTTETLPGVSHPIAKADLKEGDVLLDVAEHVVLFGGWTNAAQTEYMAYEETKPGEGTVKRATPYPYWYNTAAFKPYRYNSIC